MNVGRMVDRLQSPIDVGQILGVALVVDGNPYRRAGPSPPT
ncbi:MAG: hypothetical protein ACRDIY_12700 [Chloroflexota bacterium]